MKSAFYTVFFLLLSGNLLAQPESIIKDNVVLLPAMTFEEGETEYLPSGGDSILVMRYMFGQVTIGDSVYHEFAVKNTGTAPLIFTNIVPDCECTVAYFTEAEIQPGESGIIAAGFRMKEEGKIRHILTVLSNTPSGSDFIEIYVEGIEK